MIFDLPNVTTLNMITTTKAISIKFTNTMKQISK